MTYPHLESYPDGRRTARAGLLGIASLLIGLLAAGPLRADEIFVRASQVGYDIGDSKLAMAFSRAPLPAEFAVVDAGTGESVFTGKMTLLPGERWGQFDHHAELDFSGLRRPGRYLVRVGEARSLPFEVGTWALAGLPDDLLEFLRQQRCGYNPWLGVKCHQHDGRTA